jgi:hypothetical protein
MQFLKKLSRPAFAHLRAPQGLRTSQNRHATKTVLMRLMFQAQAVRGAAYPRMGKILWTGTFVSAGVYWWLSAKDNQVNCDSIRPTFARRLMDIAYAGTDHYGTIPDEEEEAINSTGGHWAYGEISYEGLHALLEHMDVGENSVFYDFGSGLGKVVAQCFITSGARKVVGIEMAETRHSQAWQACERIGKLLDLIEDIQSTKQSSQRLSSWFEEQPERDQALSPSFVLRSRGVDGPRELRLIHGDCLKVRYFQRYLHRTFNSEKGA